MTMSLAYTSFADLTRQRSLYRRLLALRPDAPVARSLADVEAALTPPPCTAHNARLVGQRYDGVGDTAVLSNVSEEFRRDTRSMRLFMTRLLTMYYGDVLVAPGCLLLYINTEVYQTNGRLLRVARHYLAHINGKPHVARVTVKGRTNRKQAALTIALALRGQGVAWSSLRPADSILLPGDIYAQSVIVLR